MTTFRNAKLSTPRLAPSRRELLSNSVYLQYCQQWLRISKCACGLDVHDIDVRRSRPDKFLSLRHVGKKARVLKRGLFLPPLSFIGLTFLDFARSSIWTTGSAKRCSHLIRVAMLPYLTWFIWPFGTTIPKVVVLIGDQIPLSGLWHTTIPLHLEEISLIHCCTLLPLLLILKEVFPLPLPIAILRRKVHT